MRRWLLIASVGVVALAPAFVAPSDGSADSKVITVMLTANGPMPSTVTRSANPSVFLDFENTDSVTHSLVFAGGHCSRVLAPGEIADCHNSGPDNVGTYRYTVDGRFPGTVHVVGLFRSVTLTARSHTIALGRRLTLEGRLTIDNQNAPFCFAAYRQVMLVLARHDRQSFKRIAMFPVRASHRLSRHAVNDRCTYFWHRDVRPRLSTTYIAKTFGSLYFWKAATSRPLTISVRP